MRRVLIVEGYLATLMPEGPAIEQEVLGPDYVVSNFGELKDVPAPMLQDAEALILRPGVVFGADRIGELKRCKIIVSLGVGFDHVDIVAARRCEIPVCNVPDFGTEEVADTALAMMLYLHRRLGAFHSQARSGPLKWDWRLQRPVGRARASELGLIGLGLIATSLALKAKAVGYEVRFLDPYVPHGTDKALGLTRVFNRNELLAESDIVSIHTPLTPETRGMVDREFLGAMKPTGVLINVSRGGLFQSLDALYEALKNRPDFSVGADVLPEEPPKDHPLVEAWRTDAPWLRGRVLLTPHSAFYSEDACQDLHRSSAEVASWILSGHTPYNLVNP